MVSREEAEQIAARYLAEHPGLALRAGPARRVSELGAARLSVYQAGDWRLEDSWIIFLEMPDRGLWLRSSTILVVAPGGRVVYVGSAGDEG